MKRSINDKMARKYQEKHGFDMCHGSSLNREGPSRHHHACFMMVAASRSRQISRTVILTANFIFSVIGAVHTSCCWREVDALSSTHVFR